MSRSVAAFFIAPLWVPVIVVPYTAFRIFPDPAQVFWVGMAGVLSIVFAYLGTFALGLPVFLFLRSRNWTGFWIAPVVGFVMGAATWLAFLIFFVLALDEGINGIASIGQDWTKQIGALWITGGLGALVGLTLWIIARPDRHRTTVER